MSRLPSAFLRAALIGPAATAICINIIARIVRSAWVLPLGCLLGGVLTTLVLLGGPWGTWLKPALRITAQRGSRSEAVATFLAASLLFGIIGYLQGTQYKQVSCVKQPNCTADEIFSLTVLALGETFWALLWALLAVRVWYRLHPPVARREE
jgi:hypothetical protein